MSYCRQLMHCPKYCVLFAALTKIVPGPETKPAPHLGRAAATHTNTQVAHATWQQEGPPQRSQHLTRQQHACCCNRKQDPGLSYVPLLMCSTCQDPCSLAHRGAGRTAYFPAACITTWAPAGATPKAWPMTRPWLLTWFCTATTCSSSRASSRRSSS